MPCVVVNNCPCQLVPEPFPYTCSRMWGDKTWKVLWESLHLPLKCLAVPHQFLLLLILLLCILKILLTSILFKTVFACYQIDDIVTITMHYTPCIIFSVSDRHCVWNN